MKWFSLFNNHSHNTKTRMQCNRLKRNEECLRQCVRVCVWLCIRDHDGDHVAAVVRCGYGATRSKTREVMASFFFASRNPLRCRLATMMDLSRWLPVEASEKKQKARSNDTIS